jgi:hypothetical protein
MVRSSVKGRKSILAILGNNLFSKFEVGFGRSDPIGSRSCVKRHRYVLAVLEGPFFQNLNLGFDRSEAVGSRPVLDLTDSSQIWCPWA